MAVRKKSPGGIVACDRAATATQIEGNSISSAFEGTFKDSRDFHCAGVPYYKGGEGWQRDRCGLQCVSMSASSTLPQP